MGTPDNYKRFLGRRGVRTCQILFSNENKTFLFLPGGVRPGRLLHGVVCADGHHIWGQPVHSADHGVLHASLLEM